MRGRVQRLPELAFRGGALSDRDDDDFVRRRVRDRAGEAGRLLTQEIAAGLGRSDAGQALGARRRRGREDAQRGRAPVRGHLPPRRRRVVRGAEGLQEHVPGRHPEAEADRAVAVVREEPVRPLPHVERDRRLDRLVPRAADLEEDPVLALELDLLVVDPAGRDHVPVHPEKVVARKPFVRIRFRRRDFRRHRAEITGKRPRPRRGRYAAGWAAASGASGVPGDAGACQSECGARFSTIHPLRSSRYVRAGMPSSTKKGSSAVLSAGRR